MKTAMQELIDDLVECDKRLDGRRKSEDSTVFKMSPNKLYKKALEKEKESMLDFGLYVKKNGWVGCKIEDLYEDYNNQNK